ncbi:unnamed protein product [Callosobruchus maculatus]|uniref:RRM domain-containing protein n=1 Tax=Callosobruchus maculatus TaxID=64391 RepID=A0A653CQD6_CALMS|nr:unnamed protein product [Callosobruchus maculatus]
MDSAAAAAAAAAATAIHLHHQQPPPPPPAHHVSVLQQPTTPISMPHPTTLTSLPQFLPSPALASPVGSSSSQPGVGGGMGVSNHPCSTLFVANLGQFVSEHELKEIFASFPGFSRLRMHPKGGFPVAFCEYQDVPAAQRALQHLQGSFLLSSDRGPIRVEYAKNKMATTATSAADAEV